MLEFYDKHNRVRGTDHAIFISILIHYYKWIKVLGVFLLSMILTIKPTSLIYKNKRHLLWLGCMGYGRKRQTNEKIWISYSSSFPMKIGDLTFLPSSVESSDLFSSSATKPCLIWQMGIDNRLCAGNQHHGSAKLGRLTVNSKTLYIYSWGTFDQLAQGCLISSKYFSGCFYQYRSKSRRISPPWHYNVAWKKFPENPKKLWKF